MTNPMFYFSAIFSVVMVAVFVPLFDRMFHVNAEVIIYHHDAEAEKSALFFTLLNHNCFLSNHTKDGRMVFSEQKMNELPQYTESLFGSINPLPGRCSVPEYTYFMVIEDIDASETYRFTTAGGNSLLIYTPKFNTPILIRMQDGTIHRGVFSLYA